MVIYVNANFTENDNFTMTAQEIADAVLTALGGDPAKDTCTVQLTIPTAVAGVVAPTPPVTP